MAFHYIFDYIEGMSKVTKAVIPAAGLGTRFLPATKAIPKEMLPIVDIPTIQLVVEEAIASGIEDIVIVTGRHKSAIEEHFDHAYELEHSLRARDKLQMVEGLEKISTMARIISVRQKQPLGLGHAVLCAKSVIGQEPFAVLLGDDLVAHEQPGIQQLIRAYDETGKGAIAVVEVDKGQEHLYGIVRGRPQEGRIHIQDLIEKPAPGTAPSRLAVIGRYVLPPSIWGHLEATQPGVGGEIQLTDALRALVKEKGGALLGVPIQGCRHDAGDRLGYLKANLWYALKRPELREPVKEAMRQMLRDT